MWQKNVARACRQVAAAVTNSTRSQQCDVARQASSAVGKLVGASGSKMGQSLAQSPAFRAFRQEAAQVSCAYFIFMIIKHNHGHHIGSECIADGRMECAILRFQQLRWGWHERTHAQGGPQRRSGAWTMQHPTHAFLHGMCTRAQLWTRLNFPPWCVCMVTQVRGAATVPATDDEEEGVASNSRSSGSSVSVGAAPGQPMLLIETKEQHYSHSITQHHTEHVASTQYARAITS